MASDLAGVDLNRQWLKPDPVLHPTIHLMKELYINPAKTTLFLNSGRNAKSATTKNNLNFINLCVQNVVSLFNFNNLNYSFIHIFYFCGFSALPGCPWFVSRAMCLFTSISTDIPAN